MKDVLELIPIEIKLFLEVNVGDIIVVELP